MAVVGASGSPEMSGRMRAAPASERAFLGVSALLFAASAAATIARGATMAATGGMAMPCGGAMASPFLPPPGETWPGAAASFLAMWLVMMAAMMLPSLVPMLWRYRAAVAGTGAARLGRLTVLAGAGYFSVWSVAGMAVFALGAALAVAAMELPAPARAAPIAAAAVVVSAGALQFTRWKARHLASCRAAPNGGRALPADAGTAWRHGLRLGRHCACSCAGLTAILLVSGIMDLGVMAAVTAAVTAERLAPAGERVARGIGVVAIAAGLLLLARATGLG
jgi:predicted metal-binding membrane protein